jgi:hypothetical protein
MTTSRHTANNRLVLLMIAGIPLTMILAATWLWFFVVRGDLDLVGALGTANRGQLVQPPRQLDDYPLQNPGGVSFAYADEARRWTFVIPLPRSCGGECEQMLYVTRQIHLAMGKEYNRIRRIGVTEVEPDNVALAVAQLADGRPAPATFRQLLDKEHRDLRLLVLDEPAYGQLFAGREAQAGTWFLVDPGGWLMMAYDQSIPYKDVMVDLKFLLKNSAD